MFESIEAALGRGDGAAALAAAHDAVAQRPQDPRALHLLGIAQRLCGDADGAAATLDRAVSLAPDNAQIHFSRAMLSLSANDVEAAGAALDQTVAHNPNSLTAYVMRGISAVAQSNQAHAESQLRLAQRINPDHPHVLALQGNIALRFGAASDALRPLTLAVQLAPQDVFSLSGLGLAFLASGNPAFAEQSLRRALKIQPAAGHIRWALIEALLRQGHFDDVLAEVDTLLAADPHDSGALVLLGDLRLARGDVAGAMGSYRSRFLGQAGIGQALELVLAKLLRSGASESARELFEELVGTQPEDDDIWQAGLMLEADEHQALIAYIARWQAHCPKSRAAWQTLAVSNERFGDLAGAEQAADHLLGLAPGSAAANLVKLRAELRQQPSAALARAQKLFDNAQSPTTQRVCLALRGFAHDALQQFTEAAQSWMEASRLPFAGRPLPIPAPPAPALQAGDSGGAPRLLWGPPGSAVAQVVASLNGVTGFAVLSDRFGAHGRADGLGPDRPDSSFANQAQWRAVVAHSGFDTSRVLDWLLHFDARHANQLPDAQLMVVLSDPRDMLLNWLAHGSPQNYRFPTLAEAGEWLAQTLETLAQRLESGRSGDLVIRLEALQSDPDRCARDIAQFCGLEGMQTGASLEQAGRGLGGLSLNFAAGHWKAYAEPLGEGFAPLHAIAERLGYPPV